MKEYIITTHLPAGGLYFIEKVAETGKLDTVIIQNDLPQKSIFSIGKTLIRNLFDMVLFKQNLYNKNIEKYLPGFNHTLHLVDINFRRKLKKLSQKYQFEICFTNDINNDHKVSFYLKTTKSKYILVFGGKIIKPEILKLFNGNWLNGHGGILPNYRGLLSEYWAIKNKEYDMIGCTVHYLTEKIDAGKIIRMNKIPYIFNETLECLILRNHANLILTYLSILRDFNIDNYRECFSDEEEYEGKYYPYPKAIAWECLRKIKAKDI